MAEKRSECRKVFLPPTSALYGAYVTLTLDLAYGGESCFKSIRILLNISNNMLCTYALYQLAFVNLLVFVLVLNIKIDFFAFPVDQPSARKHP